METLNQALFLALNASEAPSQSVVTAAIFLAEWPVGIAVVLASIAVLQQRSGKSLVIARLLVTVLVAMGTAYVIREVWYQPRPFVVGLGHTLLAHDPTPSFPSFHVTFLFSVGFSLFYRDSHQLIAMLVIVLGGMTAWARVYIGVHFPFDMAGALCVATVATLIVNRLSLASWTQGRKSSAP